MITLLRFWVDPGLDGYVVINEHVVDGYKEMKSQGSDKIARQVRLIGTGANSDLALLTGQAPDICTGPARQQRWPSIGRLGPPRRRGRFEDQRKGSGRGARPS